MYRVLLVDDDAHIQATNEKYLREQGYQVYRADNGPDALHYLDTTALDAVVLDVAMPELDGVTLCRRIRETSGIPVLFLSAYAQTDDRIRGLMAGGDDYLPNPIPLWSWSCGCGCAFSGTRAPSRGRSCALGSWSLTWGCGKCAMARERPP